jgi:hypothetical protein
MWSPLVDSYWHAALTDRDKYESMCLETVGSIVQHSEAVGRGEISWIVEYERRFGELSTVWFTNTDGRLNKALMEEYLWTGEVYASWDCRPLITK